MRNEQLNMADQQIVKALIGRDKDVTRAFYVYYT